MRPLAARSAGSIACITVTWPTTLTQLSPQVLNQQRLDDPADCDTGVVDQRVEPLTRNGRGHANRSTVGHVQPHDAHTIRRHGGKAPPVVLRAHARDDIEPRRSSRRATGRPIPRDAPVMSTDAMAAQPPTRGAANVTVR